MRMLEFGCFNACVCEHMYVCACVFAHMGNCVSPVPLRCVKVCFSL